MIAADPVETADFGVGVFVVLHEPMVPLVIDRVTRADLLEVVLVDLVLRRAAVGIAEIPRVHAERLVVLAVLDLAPAFEHQRLQALFGKLLRGPSAADAAAHHDGVECPRLARLFAEFGHRFPQVRWRFWRRSNGDWRRTVTIASGSDFG